MLANPFHNIGFYHLHSLSFRFGPAQAERQWANRVQSTRSLTPIEARDLRFVAVSIRHRWYERSNVDVVLVLTAPSFVHPHGILPT
jgi:hypothetical protein